MIRKSAGAVIFRKEAGKIYYLLLQYSPIGRTDKDYWGFAKGTIEQGERTIDTIKREIKEETGLENLRFIRGFRISERYFFRAEGETIFKTVFYLLGQTKEKEIKISFEHKGFVWLEFPEAYKRLSFKGAKEILRKANNYLHTLIKNGQLRI